MRPNSDPVQEAAPPHQAKGDTYLRDCQNHASSTSAGLIKCTACESFFRRPEHLRRHFRSHTKEKPFECTQCGRYFSRSDTLHRHELSHHAFGPDGDKDHAHRITVKTFRACYSCATARVRCSGGNPCARCDSRSLGCDYPTTRRSKARARKEALQRLSPTKESDLCLRDSQVRATSRGKTRVWLAQDVLKSPRQPSAYHLTEFQLPLNTQTTPNTPAQESSNQNSRKLAEKLPGEPLIAHQEVDTDNCNSHQSNSQCLGMPAQQQYPDISTSIIQEPAPLTPDQTTGVSGQHLNLQPEMEDSNVDIEMATEENQQMHLSFDQSFLDPSTLSMNWLPSDLFPNTPENPLSFSGLALQSNLSQVELLDSSLPPIPWPPHIINANHNGPSLSEGVSQTPSGSISLSGDIESPGQYSQAVSCHSEPYDVGNGSGDYYVDGGGSRLPKYRRRQSLLSRSSTNSTNIRSRLRNDLNPVAGFPLIEETGMDTMSENTFKHHIQPSTYNKIYSSFIQLCCADNFVYEKFESENFPSAASLTNFIHAYFDSFQPVYPIFHPPTFGPNRCHWLVPLAVSAIGCHVAGIPETEPCTVAFHEFLRRAIHVEKEKLCAGRAPLWLLQVMLLSCIGLLYSGGERARVDGLSSFAELVHLSNHERLLRRPNRSKTASSDIPLENKWAKWVEDEEKRRTGYCIWLVDCTLVYHFDHRPLLTLGDGQAALPSHDALWLADSAESWLRLFDKSQDISLHDAVQIIYIEKELVTGIGEYSHILLIHALYHRMWEVGDYFRRPLSFWNPTAKKQPRGSAIPAGSVWLPGIPLYSKWRNSACDCLDILHWTANSTIARAAGLEHPTVLHLHASRLVLLTPFREIRSLATSLALGKTRWSEHQRTIEWHYIWRWVKHDQYKARLAIIHAGTTLWHVRRYSTNAFHEPMAVFDATLTLWAYGYCHDQVTQYHSAHAESRSDPLFVHLDRPCDDELVQLFVREGQTMKGNVTGVGDICAPTGPERVLRVGCEILASLTSWSVSRKCIATLSGLADQASRNLMGRGSHSLDGMAPG